MRETIRFVIEMIVNITVPIAVAFITVHFGGRKIKKIVKKKQIDDYEKRIEGLEKQLRETKQGYPDEWQKSIDETPNDGLLGPGMCGRYQQ